MDIQQIGGPRTAYPGAYKQTREPVERAEDAAAPAPARDTLELSAEAEAWADGARETESASGKVGINAGKLARMLSAAKTRAQVRAVIAQIQQDLRECEDGRNRGMDVDEASARAAEALLNQARQRMGQAEDGEASPEDEAAFSLASLF